MAVVEENILRYIMEHTDSFDAIYRNIIPSYFVNTVRRHIFEQIRNAYEEKKQYTQTDIRLKLGEQENSELARIMVLEDVPVDEAVIMDYAKRLRNAALQQEYDEHSKLAVEFSRHNDPQFIQEMAKCKDIKEQMKQWS
jgi:DNA primase